MTRLEGLHLQAPAGAISLGQLASRYTSVEAFLGAVERHVDSIPGLQQASGDAQGGSEATPEGQLLQHLGSTAPRLTHGTDILSGLRTSVQLVPTGSAALDELLGGGLLEGTVSELAGESASGKSQLCHSLAVMTAHRGERVLYLDTSNAFKPARAHQLAISYAAKMPGPPVEEALSAIQVVQPHSIYAVLSCLDELALQLSKPQGSGHRVTALILDSVSAVLSPVMGGQQHNQGQVLAHTLARMLRHLAQKHSLTVLVTNHLVSASGGSSSSSGQALLTVPWQVSGGSGQGLMKPALGETWRNQPHMRVQLTKEPQGVITATVTSTTMTAAGMAVRFVITDAGFLPC